MRAAVGQVEDPGSDLGRRAVRGHIGQPDHRGRDRRRDREMEDDLRHAEDLERRLERLGGVGRAERLVRSEVACQAVRRAAGAPRQGGPRPDRRPVAVSVHPGRCRGDGPLGRQACRRGAPTRRRTAIPASPRRDAGTPSPPASAPATAAGNGSGSAYSRSNQTTAGSLSAPFGIPFSQRSKKRTSSWRSSRFGPGVRRCRAGRGPSCRRSSATEPCRRPASGAPRRRTSPSSRRR